MEQRCHTQASCLSTSIFGGKRRPDVPVLVVKEPTQLFMQNRKRRLPILVGMNVSVPDFFQPARSPLAFGLSTVRFDFQRISRTMASLGSHPTPTPHSTPTPISMTAIRVTGRQKPASQSLPCGLMAPTFISTRSIQPLPHNRQPAR